METSKSKINLIISELNGQFNLNNVKRDEIKNNNLELLRGAIRDIKDISNVLRDQYQIKDKEERAKKVTLRIKGMKLDAKTKEAFKIASYIVINNVKLRFNILTFAEMSKAITFQPEIINKIGSDNKDDADYINALKELFKKARVEYTGKRFSPKIAKSYLTD